MCIAIYKPERKTITKDTLSQCFSRNPDGAGFGHIVGGRMKIRKGFFDFPSFWKAYEPLQHKEMIIHFRIKTHGEKSVGNCHPFYVSNNLIFIHNGTIGKHPGTATISDTMEFNYKVVRPLVKQFGTDVVFAPAFEMLVKDYIGWSKLIFLDNQGRTAIINENTGEWKDGVWYSNSSYKPYEAPKAQPYLLTNYTRGEKHSKRMSQWVEKDWKKGDKVISNFRYKGTPDKSILTLVEKTKWGWDVLDSDNNIIPGFPEYFLDEMRMDEGNWENNYIYPYT